MKSLSLLALVGILKLVKTNLSESHQESTLLKLWPPSLAPTYSNGTMIETSAVPLGAQFTDARLLNGTAKLDDRHLLLADSSLETIDELNVLTRYYSKLVTSRRWHPFEGRWMSWDRC